MSEDNIVNKNYMLDSIMLQIKLASEKQDSLKKNFEGSEVVVVLNQVESGNKNNGGGSMMQLKDFIDLSECETEQQIKEFFEDMQVPSIIDQMLRKHVKVRVI